MKALDGLGDSLSPSLDFQLYQDDQVCSADLSQPLPDTMDVHDLPWSETMCPLPLASVKSPLLACPEGLDLCLCALQKTPLGRAPQDLRENTSNIRHRSPSLYKPSTDSEKLTIKDSPNREDMGNHPERGTYPPLPFHTSSFPDAGLDRKILSPLTSWPWLPPTLLSRESPIHIFPTFPGYSLLPLPYLFTYGALPSAQCPHLFMLPPDSAYSSMAASGLLMTANGSGPGIPPERTLLLYPGAFQSARHTQHSQVGSRSCRDALTPGEAGVAALARRAVPGSRAGVIALPYPLKKENGKILYECNVCGKNFGQLSNLKVHLRIHSGERPFQCALCQKRFTQLAHLQKHHLVHTGERPHQCQVCHRRFSSSSNLKTHLRLHAGARPFQCSLCPSHLTRNVNPRLRPRLQAPQLRGLAHTHQPLSSLTCLAQWHQGALDLVDEKKMGWNGDKVSLESKGKQGQPA
ncbi:tissue-resident T-cell transcription regulator protein ZNF683 isoform X2 [Grammomys surdaster]|nr:tissue-resident T-cell transcription regulator protein ZNF683 isoform X2 [Grammomys surdaster]